MLNQEENSQFWVGWTEALEALESRIEALLKALNSHSRPSDVLLDVKSEITDLKVTSLGVDSF